jgi:hypothetical protein
MLKQIEALRKQPIHIRNRYAFWIALSTTLVIAFFWGLQLPNKLSVEGKDTVAEDTSGSSFIHTLGEITSNFKNTLRNVGSTASYQRKASDTEEVEPSNTLDLQALVSAAAKAKKNEATTSAIVATSSHTVQFQKLTLPPLQ